MPFHYQHIQAATDADFVKRATEVLASGMKKAIEEKGRCVIGLSGGSTPRAVYAALGALSFDWTKVHIFLVDERYIPSDHSESNALLVRETLMRRANIPEKNLLFPQTTLPLATCIEGYDRLLRELLRSGGPDIVVLGLGEDGHLASLFPGDIDAILERKRTVLHTTTDRFAIRDRITVTLPLLTQAETPLFLLKGAAKQKIFAEALSANIDPVEYPAHALLQTGKTVWVTHW